MLPQRSKRYMRVFVRACVRALLHRLPYKTLLSPFDFNSDTQDESSKLPLKVYTQNTIRHQELKL